MSFSSISLTSQEKLDLKRLIAKSEDWQDNTENIRELKHSNRIANDVLSWINIQNSTKNPEDREVRAQIECNFLLKHYPDIYKKLTTNVLDIAIFSQFIKYLQMIEEGTIDQSEGSAIIGKLLKELYLDSAIRHGDLLNQQHSTGNETQIKRDGKDISWKEYCSGKKE